jgi:hypothetical protein
LSICNAIFNLAQLALADGDHEAAFRWFAEGIAPSEELGDRGTSRTSWRAWASWPVRGARQAGRRGFWAPRRP